MAQVNAGRVRFVGRGEYNNSTQYYTFDLVNYNGNSYFAKSNTLGNLPTNTTYWQLVAEKGNTGSVGPTGDTGNGIASITKTSTSGLVDTYTITFTNGQTTTYEITNGANGSVIDVQVDGTSVVDNGIANIIGLTEMKQELEDMYNLLPKVQGTGETITLDNTVAGKMLVDLKGNTSQETTTGKNIWNLGSLSNTTQAGVTLKQDTDGGFLLNGTSTGVGRFKIALNTDINEVITLYLKSFNNSGDIMISLRDTNDIQMVSMRNDNTLKVYSYTPTAPIRYIELIQLTSGVQYTNYKIYPMIVKGSYTSSTIGDYEPYTNGASPNPNYPQDIHIVSGDNYINVCGKNLFDKSIANLNKGINTNTGNLYNDTNCFTSDFIEVEASGVYYTASGYSTSANRVYGAQYDSNKQYVGGIATNVGDKVFYISNANTKYIRITGLSSEIDTYQLEKGSTATTYEAYKGASYEINLGDKELCKIGDYQDSIVKDNGKWYLNKQIGKYTFTENDVSNFTIFSDVGYNANNLFTDYRKENGTINIISTKYVGIKQSASNNDFINNARGYNYAVALSPSSNYYSIKFKDTRGLSANDFGNSIIGDSVYYVLATPTTTEITDSTLISQLEAVKRSYNEQTNITQTNDDKPFILDVTALKQLTE